jgi:outer membrane protein
MIVATSASAFAGLNVEVGGGMWQPSLSGHVKYLGDTIDFDTLDPDDKTTSGNNYLYLDFSHFIPLIPNIRVEKLNYNITGSAMTNVRYDGLDFSGTVKSELDMKQTDIIAYWGVPFIGVATAGILNINFGLDAKNLNGYIELTDDAKSSKVSFDETLPLLYLNAKIDIPATPVELSATTKQLSYDGASISDNQAKVSIKLPIPLPLIDFKFDIGYKSQNITIPNSLVKDLDAKIDTAGVFFGLNAKF